MINASLVGIGTTLIACVALYLASPNQRLLGNSLPQLLAIPIAAMMALIAMWALMGVMSKLAAIFLCVSVSMLALAVLPYLAALKNSLGKVNKS